MNRKDIGKASKEFIPFGNNGFVKKKTSRPKDSISMTAEAARKMGMSYGKYVGKYGTVKEEN